MRQSTTKDVTRKVVNVQTQGKMTKTYKYDQQQNLQFTN